MSRFTQISWLVSATVLVGLAACGGGVQTTDPSLAYTQIWLTVEVAQTQTALSSSPTPSATNTPAISPTPRATNTPLLTNTPLTAVPSTTSYSISTQAGAPSASCDNANFIKDVTIQDGEEVAAGSAFVKTWRFENLGPCNWTTSYSLVYSYMSDTGKNGVLTPPGPVAFPNKVLPGEQMDISVTLHAPTKAGTYQMVFVLHNENGYSIPLKNMNSYEFWVTFVVK